MIVVVLVMMVTMTMTMMMTMMIKVLLLMMMTTIIIYFVQDFIFAGYKKEMEGFLKSNPGMARRCTHSCDLIISECFCKDCLQVSLRRLYYNRAG